MQQIIERLIAGEHFSLAEAHVVMHTVVTQEVPATQVAAFLALLRTRPLTLDELSGFRDALFELRDVASLDTNEFLDVCGTGGDKKGTFNVSTTAAFIAAGAGIKVAKHGNYSSSSAVGSSNVIEALGIRFSSDRDRLLRAIEQSNMCVLHAPLFQPHLKRIGAIRRELGVRTVFNLLGPLLNPLEPRHQLIGVPSLDTLSLFSDYLRSRGTNFLVVHSPDGYDEISLTGPFVISDRAGKRVVEPRELNLNTVAPQALVSPPDPNDGARVILDILRGKSSQEMRQVALVNAAYAIGLVRSLPFEASYAQAVESLDSFKAMRALELLREVTTA